MWAAFANGRTVPDPFRHFFNAGVYLDTHWLRDDVLGYGIVRRITVLHADNLDRNAINAFLVTLPIFERALNLCRHTKLARSMWDLILHRDPSRPTNNWEGVCGFMNWETYVLTAFGLTFTPPCGVGGHNCGEGKTQIRYFPMRIIWTQEKLFLSF
jgi:hypothetical protein